MPPEHIWTHQFDILDLKLKRLFSILATAAIMAACSSNNCPLENFVACNYGFYDQEGKSVTILDTVTVKTLLPGYKTVYTYRRLGYMTVTKERIDSSMIKAGYTMKPEVVRRDTILLNRLTKASTFKLPMSYFNAEDTLVISYSSIALADTIKVTHDSYPYVELPECGSYRFHYLRNVQSTDRHIDHVEISNPKVNYDGNENIKIYLNGTAE